MFPLLLTVLRIEARQHARGRYRESQFTVAGRAGDIRHVVFVSPNDMGLGHIALPIGADGQQLLRRAGDDQQAAGEHRRGGDLAVEAFRPPEFRAIRRRVSDDTGNGQRDDLRFSGGLDNDGSRPGSPHFARTLPDDLASAPVQAVEFGFVVFGVALVELHDQAVLPGGQGSRVTIGVLERAETLGPGWLPFQGECRAVAVCEDHIDAPAIRRHRRSRIPRGFWNFGCLRWPVGRPHYGLPPKSLPCLAVQADDLTFLCIAAGEEHPIAPDDWRVEAAGRDGHLPRDARPALRVPCFGQVRQH